MENDRVVIGPLSSGRLDLPSKRFSGIVPGFVWSAPYQPGRDAEPAACAAGNLNKKALSLTFSFLLLAGISQGVARAGANADATGTSPSAQKPADVRGDRWVEIDLYWFDRENIGRSAEEFWDRFNPLFAGVDGWRGVILNVGWTSSYILDWRGNLGDRISLPTGMKEQNWFKVTGMLTGTTEERQRQWKERFRDPASHLKRGYQPWTYADVKSLADALRRVASGQGLKDIRVGSLVLGCRTIYGGADFPFTLRHPNVFARGPVFGSGVFDPRAKLSRDETAYGAYPNGVAEGTPVTEFFGSQWGSMSKAVGLDALVLRDSMIGPVTYRRVGPFGTAASPDAAEDARWTTDTAALVRLTKQANPRALIIGYSTGASAVGEWRVDCVDLEAIAREGFLDAWIDQTWAGAWNEVGVREGGFWNAPYLGWTYQLGFVLVHSAQLAGTKTRHYVLTETFDAWESWDIIHTAPERLRWGIWAYLHAAVKTPGGLEMPRGSYISWANQGSRLLSREDVDFLATETNGALLDARGTTEVFGPTLVYDRPALAWQQAHAPEVFMGEWIDEQAAALLKWGVPILSITRIEYLPKVDADMLVLQTPVHLESAAKLPLGQWVASGRPLALFGSLSTGIDQDLAKLAGVSGGGLKPETGLKATAVLGERIGGLAGGIPGSFPLYQPASANESAPPTEVIYSVNGSPALTLSTNGRAKVVCWDPADLSYEAFPDWLDIPLIERMGSVYPFVLAARTIADSLKGTGSPFIENIDATTPATVLAWKKSDGTFNVLAAELEEGLSDAARTPFELRVKLPAAWSNGRLSWSARWSRAQGGADDTLEIPLSQSKSELYLLRN